MYIYLVPVKYVEVTSLYIYNYVCQIYLKTQMCVLCTTINTAEVSRKWQKI